MIPAQPMSLEREQNRIEALKARNAARVSRFLNSKQRTMGIDVEALDQQVQENKEKIVAEKRELIEESRKQASIMQTLDTRNKERDELRCQDAARLRGDWQAAVKEKDQRKLLEEELGHQPVNSHDLGCKERIKTQQKQLRQWTAEQQKFKAELHAIETEKNARHNNLDAMVYHKQLEFGSSSSAVRKAHDKEILQSNLRLAEEKAAREKFWRAMQSNEEEMELRVRQEALKEVKGKVSNDVTGRMLCDRYKGLSDEEVKAIYVENRKVHEEYLLRKDDEIASERAWAMSEEAVLRQMEATEAERKTNHTRDLFAVQEHLKAQRGEAKVKRAQSKADRLDISGVTIAFSLPPPSKIRHLSKVWTHSSSEGIYAGFETSCR